MAHRASKTETLRAKGTLNPQSEQVHDPLFASHEFFDADDLLQVKYEMLRRVSVDGLTVSEAAARFGADWVLVYSSRVSTHPDTWVFAPDEVHGLCLVECALLDTRTGLIPFTARSVEEVHVEGRSGEELPALVARAEAEAIDAALLENARALVAFLGVALVRFVRMLQVLEIGWTRGLPVALLFVGAAAWLVKRSVPRFRQLRRGEDHGISRLR